MALTTRQRKARPRSAFGDPVNRRFPMPTKAQARKAGISERQRLNTLRNARSRAAQPQARGVKKVTPALVKRKVRARAGGKIASVRPRSGSTRRRRR
jgi:hypothetical protein